MGLPDFQLRVALFRNYFGCKWLIIIILIFIRFLYSALPSCLPYSFIDCRSHDCVSVPAWALGARMAFIRELGLVLSVQFDWVDLLYQFFGIVLVLLVSDVFVDGVESCQSSIIKYPIDILWLQIINRYIWYSNIKSIWILSWCWI